MRTRCGNPLIDSEHALNDVVQDLRAEFPQVHVKSAYVENTQGTVSEPLRVLCVSWRFAGTLPISWNEWMVGPAKVIEDLYDMLGERMYKLLGGDEQLDDSDDAVCD